MTTTDRWIVNSDGNRVAAFHGGLGGPALYGVAQLRDPVKQEKAKVRTTVRLA